MKMSIDLRFSPLQVLFFSTPAVIDKPWLLWYKKTVDISGGVCHRHLLPIYINRGMHVERYM